MSVVCEIFKSSRQPEMYLYVEKTRGLEDVPDDLMKRFGEPQPVMVLLLKADRKLARADVVAVMASIEQQGFYLQMPPTIAELMVRESGRD